MAKDNKPEPSAAPASGKPQPTPPPPPEPAVVKTFEELHAQPIQQKVLAGLTRAQAVEVIKAQLAHDQSLAAAPSA